MTSTTQRTRNRKTQQQPRLTAFFQGRKCSEVISSTKENEVSTSIRRDTTKRGLEATGERTSRKRKNENGSKFGVCPLCSTSYPWHILESHAASCTGQAVSATTQPLVSSTKTSTGLTSQLLLKPTCEPIPGLFVYEDFITVEEEAEILQGLDHGDDLPWKPANFNGTHFGKRWGVHCNLRDRRVDAPENPLPEFLRRIVLPKLCSLPPMMGCIPNEANAIDYRRQKGHWLKAHVDDRKLSKEPIANLSLAGDCYMTFQNQAMNRNLAVTQQKVLLKRRCLQILTSKARYDFSHAIARDDLLTDRRVSITMRESPLTVLTAPTPTTKSQVSTSTVADMWEKRQEKVDRRSI